MVKISKVTRQKDSYEITLSNNTTLLLTQESKEEFLLYTGKELTTDDLTQIKNFDQSVKPFRYVLSILSKHSYTTKMIKEKLMKRKVEEVVIDDILKRLTNSGLLNDEEYAKERVNYLIKTKNAAKNAIINDLRAKGINQFVIEDILATYADFEEQQLFIIIAKLFSRYQKLSHKKAKDNMINKLLRDGFSYENINRVLQTFTFSDYINEDANLAREVRKLVGDVTLLKDSDELLLYNKLNKAGYPHDKIKALFRRD